MRILGKTVLLREFAQDDSGPLFKVYGDADATRHLSFEPRTMEQVSDIVVSSMESATADPRSVYMLAVADIASDELIGAARLALGEHQSAQIGFALRPDQWGQGKGIETVRLLLELGFKDLGLHRIWGARSPVNQVSARTMLAVGMIEEGTIRGHLFTRGAWRDSVVHSILFEEYSAKGLGLRNAMSAPSGADTYLCYKDRPIACSLGYASSNAWLTPPQGLRHPSQVTGIPALN